jgi:hypothetical protein
MITVKYGFLHQTTQLAGEPEVPMARLLLHEMVVADLDRFW